MILRESASCSTSTSVGSQEVWRYAKQQYLELVEECPRLLPALHRYDCRRRALDRGEGGVVEGWGDVGRGSGANVYAGAVTDIPQWLPFVPSTLTFRGAAHVTEACSW